MKLRPQVFDADNADNYCKLESGMRERETMKTDTKVHSNRSGHYGSIPKKQQIAFVCFLSGCRKVKKLACLFLAQKLVSSTSIVRELCQFSDS